MDRDNFINKKMLIIVKFFSSIIKKWLKFYSKQKEKKIKHWNVMKKLLKYQNHYMDKKISRH